MGGSWVIPSVTSLTEHSVRGLMPKLIKKSVTVTTPHASLLLYLKQVVLATKC